MGALSPQQTARRSWFRGLVRAFILAAIAAIGLPAAALAHVERASYWPDPAPDCSISPCAGGAVPTPKTLASAVTTDKGSTRVVCQKDSITRLQSSIAQAETTGYKLRPTQAA